MLIIHAERSRRRRRTPVSVPVPTSEPPNVGLDRIFAGQRLDARVVEVAAHGQPRHRRQLDRRREHRGEHLVLGVDLLLAARHRPALSEERDLELLEELSRVLRRSCLSFASARTRNLLSSSSRFTSGERARTIFGGGDLITDKRISRESAPSHGKRPAIISYAITPSA